MKIAYLGAGTWGFCLASLLAKKGEEVTAWSIEPELVNALNNQEEHPKMSGFKAPKGLTLTTSLSEALEGAELIVESVTSAGIRPVMKELKKIGVPDCVIVATSKGIEQGSGLLLTEVILDVLGDSYRDKVGCISGPSHAEEVVKGLPTSVVASGYNSETISTIQKAFHTDFFRVYPNVDINGVEFGAAMKNIIAIACGISDGLGFGDNTKAALMTRGLHEIVKLSVTKECNPKTLNGLSGMGDLCVTCLSILSRNYRFGNFLAEGLSAEEAKKKIGMVVEGTYSVVSAMELGKKHNIDLPITSAIYGMLYQGITPRDAVKSLLSRQTKQEHL
jgi:glycerol-3-phosphate dehydrogenase (NAD(P)+)